MVGPSRYVAEIEAVVIEGPQWTCPRGQVHQHALEAIGGVAAVVGPHAQLLLHLLIIVLKQDLPRLDNRLLISPESGRAGVARSGLDFFGLSAVSGSLGVTPLEIDTGADGAENFVAGRIHLRKLEICEQQLVLPLHRPHYCGVEVDHHHVVF